MNHRFYTRKTDFKEEKDALALIEELNGKQAKVKSIVKNIAKKRSTASFQPGGAAGRVLKEV